MPRQRIKHAKTASLAIRQQVAALKRAEEERTREERRSARSGKIEENELLIAAKQEQLRERARCLSFWSFDGSFG